jgi:hypothetical protein
MDPYTRQLEEEVSQYRAALRTAQQDYATLADCALAYLRAADVAAAARGEWREIRADQCAAARAALLAALGEEE